eukprot:gnl/TRDRNA2_/TRDRNA2_158526_c0_seq2.p2 gnl/TRDRNA2_/TRDRNA2_158526_c0~~gnl/TRDRNA2_/TRDRNA2_158526_c0_seq2.p2  ORF type:complete len:137 (-),score=10.43 gnl/TRDRNA2_/TRDRNA2_158526_c0_seq2:17-427(-)
MDGLGLLCSSGSVRGTAGPCEYVVCDALSPPTSWRDSYDVVVEKGLMDTLLFGDRESALDRATRYAAAVSSVLRPDGVLLQLSDAPLELRKELFEALWQERGSDRYEWTFETCPTGAFPLSLLVARRTSKIGSPSK